ncbi:MAG: nickel pincer cofactor biosynthesis protein LarC [Oscillospiraceae bacterium]|jgi:uncharacterized protein (TIGR00299 family) protein|nr:nickel pincer cofactor biosynthesis protein LarC [Oscillospiraceae bacterium]
MTLHLELNMGAAGDMLLGALYELLPDRDAFVESLRALNLPDVEIAPEQSVKCGVVGTHMRVTVRGDEEHSHDDHGHAHSHAHDHVHTHSHASAKTYNYNEILDLIARLDVPQSVRDDAAAVYKSLGEAESAVHGAPIEQVHFHEIGTLDALADIVGVSLAVHELAPDEITATAVHVGSGNVRCAHGVVPIPAPAAARLLAGIPIYGGDIKGELCTPTGAALLRHFVTRFGDMRGTVQHIGYGMGSKDFERLNAVRAFVLDDAQTDELRDTVTKLECNLDDMTAEQIGFAAGELMRLGALDVFLTPIQMKKFRPATMLSVLCKVEDEDATIRRVFALTATLGVRIDRVNRAVLAREIVVRDGVRVKIARGYGVEREKVEYDDWATAINS